MVRARDDPRRLSAGHSPIADQCQRAAGLGAVFGRGAFRAGVLASVASLADRSAREDVLREAAALGVELLGGEEPQA